MTNTTVTRKDILTPHEKETMLTKADTLPTKYFRLRAKAVLALLETGKRRSEIASLQHDDLKVDGEYLLDSGKNILEGKYLHVTFTVVKKRKKSEVTKRRTKKYPVSSKWTAHILAYTQYLKQHHPENTWLFPSGHSVFGQAYIVDPSRHLKGQEIWRIVKALNPRDWPHLHRETRGAQIVMADEKRLGEATLETVYRVKRALDLERETTAWNYINRYATEKIADEEEIVE